ncbi:hypothetical protein BDR06DRAFT_977442 [Suillus hirtellus]|nr:hypothetical protein BDR06DRAFT_977442 [Suillus hirtellus]
MGCHIMMLVSHKKQANQTLNVTLHESQPRNVKKSFSVSSDGIKEWTSTGFEFFAKWAKEVFTGSNALSTDSSYLELIDAVKDLANMMEKIDMVMASLELLMKAPIRSSDSAALVVLGLGLILRDCKRVIEYEEDEALPGTPSYLASSIMDLQYMIKVDRAISDAASSIVGLIELAMKVTSDNLYDSNQGEIRGVSSEDKDKKEEEDKDKEEKEKEKEKEKDQDDEQKEVTEDLDVQMQEVKKDDEAAKSKKKKRVRNQTSSVKTKKARFEEEPIHRSTRSRQPSRKNIL